MGITKLALKRPVSVVLLLITIVFFAITSLGGFQMGALPDMNFPTLVVSTVYPGADADVIDATISQPLEDVAKTLGGFESVSATSMENYSIIVYSFGFETNIDEAYTELQTEIDALNLPEDAGQPSIIKAAANSDAAMTLSVTSNTGSDVLAFVQNSLEPDISTLNGVAQVEVVGGNEGYVQVLLNEQAMELYGLGADDVSNAIKASNYSIPAGSVMQGDQELSVYSGMSTDSLGDISDIPIYTATSGIVSLRDVADVSLQTSPTASISRYNGNSNIMLEVTAEQNGDMVQISEDVTEIIEESILTNDDINIEVVSDASDDILSSLSSVATTLLIALVLCMAIILLFLGDIKASIIVGCSIPVSLCITIICMFASGFELNNITSIALVITIGMTVDNAIVVLESIFKNKKEGVDHKTAAIIGVKAVAASVIASTITTIVVYVPMLFLTGLVSEFFTDMAFTIIFAMVASILAALTIVPLFYTMFKPTEKQGKGTSGAMHKLENVYGKLLSKVLRRKAITVILAVAALFGTFSLARNINITPMPTSDTGTMSIVATFQPGTDIEAVNEQIIPVEEKLLADDERIDGFTLSVSDGSAKISAYVADGLETQAVIDEYRAELSGVTGYDLEFAQAGMMAPQDTSTADLTVTGTDYDEVQKAAEEVTGKLYDVTGVTNVISDISATKSKVNVEIDQVLAMQAGVNSMNALNTIRLATTGSNAGSVTFTDTEYEILVEYPHESYDAASDLATLAIPTMQGGSVPLESIAYITFTDAMQEINRVDGSYVIEIGAIMPAENNEATVAGIDALIAESTYPGAEVDYKQEARAVSDTIGQLLGAIAMSIFLVFLVMAMQFESPRFSFMVMITVAFAFIGSILLMVITQLDISMISLMGMLMLVGIVVNNGILFVDTVNVLKHSMPIEEALIKTGQMRLRPILMTTLTTILSMIPLALGIGEGTEVLQGMGVVIIGGLVTSTLLVLLLMPTFYMLMSKKKKDKKAKKAENMQEGELNS